ncbi:MAG: EAL domain-containing protein [Hyphomonadaceae bacterium]|nr:EAL domain-containing protein [Hyphomonadaceae bacterium]
MPIVTHALLYAGYALVSLTIGLALSQIGGAAAAEAFLGGLALFCACAITHGTITAAAAAGAIGRTEKRIRGEIDRLREADRAVNADLDDFAARMQDLERAVQEIAERPPPALPAPQPAPDIRMIDQLVDRLERAMESRLATASGAAPRAARGPIDIVREALHENRVELHLQPIVSLPQRKTAFYEGYTRLKDASGRLILPQDFIPAAEEAGMMTMIDYALLFRCVHIVRRLQKQDRRVGIFCNLSPRVLADDAIFPQFHDFMRENRDLAGAVIFEIPQHAYDARTSLEARAMAKLTELGFRFSIDKVSDLAFDLPDLERAGVRYVKAQAHDIVAQWAREGVRPRSAITREIDAADIVAVMQRYGIDLIAERIETENAVVEILDLNCGFGQGHLFGAARAIKDSLMEETAPPPGFFDRTGRFAAN